VSPAVDVSAYAFSWLFLLLPLAYFSSRDQQVVMLLIVVGLTFAHRHYTLPYVYLDREIFETHPRRFVWFPTLMVVGFLASPALWNTRARIVVAAVVFVAGAWNVWHVYAQKFGVLRMYAAKSGSSTQSPRWVDRALLFCWVPLYLVWLGPSYRSHVETAFPTVRDLALPLIDAMAMARPVLLLPAIGCVVAGLGVFAAFEWRSQRLGNAPRLVMAVGTTLLSASFLVFNPVHVFMAFAFSHAVEYMVFVWAFQRRRYATTHVPEPRLGRILRRPWLAYGVFTLGITGPYLLMRFWGYLIVPSATNPVILGTTIERWAFYWSVFQSLVHFYYDGFLWKMRAASVRSNL
jgi:hypothetical protein